MSNEFLVALVLISVFSLNSVAEAGPRYPVILVPGDGGSQLEVMLNKTTSKRSWCERTTSGYTSLWVNMEELASPMIYCFVDNMVLEYDNTTRTTRSPEGVHIRTVGFGDTASVEWLDPTWFSHEFASVSYFYPIVKDLVAAGYERNVSVRGAPFDFRKAPNEFGRYYEDLRGLIEDTYALNNQTRCVLVAHSMGNPVLLYFLNHQPRAWKDKYVHALVSLAGVWAGAVKIVRLFASGDNLGIPIISPITVRSEQRSIPSSAFLLPSDRFWRPEEVLLVTEHRNYTVGDYRALFRDLGLADAWEMRRDTQGLVRDLTPPGVRVHCLHGSGIPTDGTLVYAPGSFPDGTPAVVSDDGDGTVNTRSLEACTGWSGQQKQPVSHTVLPHVEHLAILRDPQALKYIVQVGLGQL
ncbi:hypothetical protein EGW08_002513 [Elysia chlorotica]|uniref:Group XV phospholipase A2 n=1 Tax=Elysia chlorotica TaxID=188477 RepID=A0A3S1A3I3_ELYCH|nr:hypothetical protein EGW08_002513 [Elysia chlorotica]